MTNILMISFDDLNDWSSVLGGYGGTVSTPNLDRLAAQGTVFGNAFTTTPLCNPARSATLSGMPAEVTGVFGNGDDLFSVVDPAMTLPGVFNAAGYTTVSAGKVFHDLPDNVAAQIYDEVLIEQGSGDSEKVPTPFTPTLSTGGETGIYTGDPALLKDVQTAEAVADFLRDYVPGGGDAGLLLTAGIGRPHTPRVVPQEYFDLYPLSSIVVPTQVPQDLLDVPAFAEFFRNDRDYDDLVASGEVAAFIQAYLASVSFADAMLGKMLDALADSAIAEDTMVVLWSDHGYQLGEKGHVGKYTLWEEAARVPLIIADPNAPPATTGTVVTEPVSLLDLFPTLVDYAGLTPPAGLTGQSLRDLIETGADGSLRGYAVTTIYGSESIRTETFRYTRYEDGSEELFDLVADPDSLDNLAADAAFAATKAQLIDRLDDELAVRPGLENNTGAPAVLDASATGDKVLIASLDADTLIGGAGDNVYVIANVATVIIETGNGGYDRVITRSTYTLPSNVEALAFAAVTSAGGEIILTGNGGANLLEIFSGSATLDGAGGNDTLVANEGDDVVLGGAGQDTVNASGGNDTIDGGDGDDSLEGGRGDDVVRLSGGTDTLKEGKDGGRDTIDVAAQGLDNVTLVYDRNSSGNLRSLTVIDTATGASLKIDSAGGSLTVEAIRDGVQTLLLAKGLEIGGSGDDRITGSSGIDTIQGGGGNDCIEGAAGDDSLVGEGGNDTLAGGGGADVLVGGGGKDRFVFSALSDSAVGRFGADRIADFVQGQDRINLSGIDAKPGTGGDDAFVLHGAAFTAPGQLRLSQNADTTFVVLNTDGDVEAEMTIAVTGLLNLTASDFVL